MTQPLVTLSRRRILSCMAASCAAACCAPGLAWARPGVIEAVRQRGGCSLLAGEMAAINTARGGSDDDDDDTMIPSSGDKLLDQALGMALVRITQVFKERPGFAFYDDSSSPNAYATSDTRVHGTWGTILFGRSMFRSLIHENHDNGIVVIATIAHEMSHIVQFHHNLQPRLMAGQRTVKRVELHADYLAGFYLGTRKRDDPSITLLASGALFRDLGDDDVQDREHHGTPGERIASAERGFKIGISGGSLQNAIDEGMRYALTA